MALPMDPPVVEAGLFGLDSSGASWKSSASELDGGVEQVEAFVAGAEGVAGVSAGSLDRCPVDGALGLGAAGLGETLFVAGLDAGESSESQSSSWFSTATTPGTRIGDEHFGQLSF